MKFSAVAIIACAGSAVAQSSLSLTQALSSRPELSALAGLVGNVSGLANQLGMMQNITLLAPNNAAIQSALNTSTGMMLSSNPALLQAVLTYHVIQGNYPSPNATAFLRTSLTPGNFANVTDGQRVEVSASNGNVTFTSGLLQNSSVVTNGTISFSGGTIHIINKLLTVPQNVTATAVASNLTSVVGALTALNLTSAVSTTKDLTIFVPSNSAFQAIGGNLANLSTAQLTSILQYHVVPGVYYSTNITNGSSVAALAGGNITLRVIGGSVYANGAKVASTRPSLFKEMSNMILRLYQMSLSPMVLSMSSTES